MRRLVYISGKESIPLASTRHFVQSFEDALLFVTMMVIAEGFGVVRSQIKHYRWTSLLCESCMRILRI